jgi:hypothetical protein
MVEGFEWLAEIDDWWGQRDWIGRARVGPAPAHMVSDEMVDRWTVCGSARSVVEKLRELEGVGVTRFTGYPGDLSFDELQQQIRLYGEKVIPEFVPTQAKVRSGEDTVG